MELELSIGAVADRTGVAPSALRFYEAEGLISSTRTDGNQRRYHRDVLRRVSFIRVAQRVGLSLEEIHEALPRCPSSRTPTQADWARLSQAWRPRLDEQIQLIERLRRPAGRLHRVRLPVAARRAGCSTPTTTPASTAAAPAT